MFYLIERSMDTNQTTTYFFLFFFWVFACICQTRIWKGKIGASFFLAWVHSSTVAVTVPTRVRNLRLTYANLQLTCLFPTWLLHFLVASSIRFSFHYRSALDHGKATTTSICHSDVRFFLSSSPLSILYPFRDLFVFVLLTAEKWIKVNTISSV